MLRKCYIIPLARQIEIQPLFLASLVIMITLKSFIVIIWEEDGEALKFINQRMIC